MIIYRSGVQIGNFLSFFSAWYGGYALVKVFWNDVPFKLVGILLGVGAYSEVGADSVLYGITLFKQFYVNAKREDLG